MLNLNKILINMQSIVCTFNRKDSGSFSNNSMRWS